jgi:hypothetical protein
MLSGSTVRNMRRGLNIMDDCYESKGGVNPRPVTPRPSIIPPPLKQPKDIRLHVTLQVEGSHDN